MEYSEAYQRTRDIDWFFQSGNRCIHVASNGGILPCFVNNVLRLRAEQAKVSMLEDIKDVEIVVNESYVNQRIAAIVESYRRSGSENVNEQNVRASYLVSFIAMARKGFYSYDRANSGESAYVLICGPIRPVEIGIQLPEADGEIHFEDEDKKFFLVDTHYNNQKIVRQTR